MNNFEISHQLFLKYILTALPEPSVYSVLLYHLRLDKHPVYGKVLATGRNKANTLKESEPMENIYITQGPVRNRKL